MSKCVHRPSYLTAGALAYFSSASVKQRQFQNKTITRVCIRKLKKKKRGGNISKLHVWCAHFPGVRIPTADKCRQVKEDATSRGKEHFWWTITKIGCKCSQRRFFFPPGRHQICQHAPVFLTDAGQRRSRRSWKQISDWALEMDVVDCSAADTVREHNEQFFHCLPAFAVCGSWLAGRGDNNRGAGGIFH